MLKFRSIDATTGRLIPAIILFSIPIMLSTLIQTLFNAVDIIVLRFAADNIAVASVGATGTITALIVNTFIGLSGGTQVLLARFLGAKDRENAKSTINTSMIASLIIGILTAVIGFVFTDAFLRLTNCPEDCINGAKIYLEIYFLASPAILVYNFGSSILRTSGDTSRPLVYMILSGGLNVVLNLILCLTMKKKVAAVAIATLASQILGALLVVIRLTKTEDDCRIDLRHLTWNMNIFKRVMRLGIPSCLHNALFPLANLQIQSAINSFGAAAIAGNTASGSIEGLVGSAANAFGTSALTFVGQNVGAGKRDRVKQSFRVCFIFSFVIALFLGILCYSYGESLMSLYVGNDAAAIEYGMIRARYILLFYCVAAMNSTFGSTLQAFGYATFVSLNSIFAVFIFRLIWMAFIYPKFPSYECVMVCFLISWMMMFVCNIFMTLVVFRKYRNNTLHQV